MLLARLEAIGAVRCQKEMEALYLIEVLVVIEALGPARKREHLSSNLDLQEDTLSEDKLQHGPQTGEEDRAIRGQLLPHWSSVSLSDT
jgi:hypothetical protein